MWPPLLALLGASPLARSAAGSAAQLQDGEQQDQRRVVLVVPCYNEELRLPAARYLEFLAEAPLKPTHVSFLFVNDGSKDGTLEMLRSLEKNASSLYGAGRVGVLDVQPNGGKAEAVRKGLLAALEGGLGGGHAAAAQALNSNDVVGFWDGDLATPLAAVPDLLGVFLGAEEGPERLRCSSAHCPGPSNAEASAALLPEVDMVFGARVGLLGRDVKRKISRHYLGRVFATLASWLLGIPIYDTQCGAKLFRPTAQLRDALVQPFRAGWIFDVELLARLSRGYEGKGGSELADAIFEYPLHRWHDLPGSNLKLSAKVGALGGLARIYWDHFSPWKEPWPPESETSTAQPEL